MFGGAANNHMKLNDLWRFDGSQWVELKPKAGDEVPQERGGLQAALYMDRYFLIFGGIYEVTYELNDLHLYDIKTGRWYTIEEDNKNASESGSPRNKAILQ